LVDDDDDCGRFAGSTGFGLARSRGVTGIARWGILVSTDGCFGARYGRVIHDTASMEQTFEGRSPREHRATDQLQRWMVATDSLTDQGLEAEESV